MNKIKNFILKCKVLGATILISLGPIGTALAQIDEIIVTSPGHVQNIQDAGIAVAAFDAEAIKNFDLDENYEVTAFTPGLNMVPNGGYSGKINFTLRGVGLNNFSEAQEGAVAIYQDDIYVVPRIGSIVGAFNTDRIEVLRGPQDTFFGRSAMTGDLVHYVSKRLGDKFEGHVAVSYGAYNEHHGELAVGGPFSDKVAVRVSGHWNQYDGWLENTIDSDRYGEERWAARGQVELPYPWGDKR